MDQADDYDKIKLSVPPSRLETGRWLSRLLLRPQERERLTGGDKGPYSFVIAEPHEPLGEVIARARDAPPPVSVCVRVGDEIVALKLLRG